jgi:hypothetical protein
MYESYIANNLEQKSTRKQYAHLANLIKKLSEPYDGGKVFGKKK